MTAGPPQIAVAVEDDRWLAQGGEAVCRRALETALSELGLGDRNASISVLLTDDRRVAGLNAAFRGRDAATNVLSWPAQELAAGTRGGQPRAPQADFDGLAELGDMALAYDTCAGEAGAQGKRFADHVAHLAVHGLLHLLGYDHVDDADALLMERIETRILENLGIADPYRMDI